jgi:hypothetical protein
MNRCVNGLGGCPASVAVLVLALFCPPLSAQAPSAVAKPVRLRTTAEFMSEIIPVLEAPERKVDLWRAYRPELGDIIFREGHEEMFWPYKVFCNTPFTHSSIVTQVEPEIIVTHCTKEKYVNGVHETPLRIWALRAKSFEVHRLKNRTPETIEKVLQACRELCDEGIFFDKSWDFTKSIPAPGKKRRMYCTVMIWYAFKAAGIDLVPHPRVENLPHRKLLLRLAGIEANVLYTIDRFQQSAALERVARFKIEVMTVSENIRLKSNITADLRDYKPPPPNIPIENPDPRVMVPTYKGRTIPLRRNPIHALKYGDRPPGQGPTIRQTLKDIGEN